MTSLGALGHQRVYSILNQPAAYKPFCEERSAYTFLVRLDDLNADQLAAVAAIVARQRDYLGRLRDRMRELRFAADDPLFASVSRALQEVSNVVVVASAARSSRPVMERKPWSGG